MQRLLQHLLLPSAVLLLLSSCGTLSDLGSHLSPFSDSPPTDLATIPNAAPKEEPRCKYGNMASYRVKGIEYRPLRSAYGFTEEGIASWYGPNFQGKPTSCMETYDRYQMTAAHKTLPLPSYVEVTNRENGKRIVVRVNDRGPFHEGRIIDLSYTAAWKLDLLKKGTAPVSIRVLTPGSQSPVIEVEGSYLQLGLFSQHSNAAALRQKLGQRTPLSTEIRSLQRQQQTHYQLLIRAQRGFSLEAIQKQLKMAGIDSVLKSQ